MNDRPAVSASASMTRSGPFLSWRALFALLWFAASLFAMNALGA